MEQMVVAIIWKDKSTIHHVNKEVQDKGWKIPSSLGSTLFWSVDRPRGIYIIEDGDAPIPVGVTGVTPYGKETSYFLTRV